MLLPLHLRLLDGDEDLAGGGAHRPLRHLPLLRPAALDGPARGGAAVLDGDHRQLPAWSRSCASRRRSWCWRWCSRPCCTRPSRPPSSSACWPSWASSSLGGLPLLLLALPLQIALTLGLGLLLGAVHVFFRDTAQVLGMVFTGWFYLTPIVYPAALVPARFRGLDRAQSADRPGGALPPGFAGRRARSPWCPGRAPWRWRPLCYYPSASWLFGRLKTAFVDEI